MFVESEQFIQNNSSQQIPTFMLPGMNCTASIKESMIFFKFPNKKTKNQKNQKNEKSKFQLRISTDILRKPLLVSTASKQGGC